MKKLLFMFAAVGVLFTACNKDCGHEFIEHDFTKDIVGTWTTLNGELAEAMVIKEDGSFTTTGVMKGGALYEEKGTIKVVNNKVTLAFEGDNETFEGRLEFVAGKSLSIVMFDDDDVRLTYDYCENDLADEIIGMWVCHEGLPDVENDMAVVSYSENGKITMTTQASAFISADLVNTVSSYVVVGDLLFMNVEEDGIYKYVARLAYTPNGNSLGDIFTQTLYAPTENGIVKVTSTFLRVKQNLNLAERTYDYISAYVTNAKGKDEDFTVFDSTFNIAKIEAYDFDKLFGADLHIVELLNNSIKHTFRPNGQNVVLETPITVDGNKVTLDYSNVNPACRKVEVYMFQDKDDTQLHMYMPTSSFVNYFANMEFSTLLTEGKIDPTDATAIEKVYTDMEARIESINVSFVFKARE